MGVLCAWCGVWVGVRVLVEERVRASSTVCVLCTGVLVSNLGCVHVQCYKNET